MAPFFCRAAYLEILRKSPVLPPFPVEEKRLFCYNYSVAAMPRFSELSVLCRALRQGVNFGGSTT